MISIVVDLIKNKFLILELAKRDILSSYRGTIIGVAWTLINSLIMLTIYTFLFSFVFKTRWGGKELDEPGSIVCFSMVLFSGLIIYNFFIEILTRAPSIVVGNVNFVKKLVFPLHVLAYVVVSRALFNFCINFFVLIVGNLIVSGNIQITSLWLPLILLPLIFYSLGVVWLVSSISVYLRDLTYIIQSLTICLLFLSPVFFPVTAVPEKIRFLIYLNPLTTFIEQFRTIFIYGENIQGYGLLIQSVLGFTFMCFGYLVFSKLRKGFADVL